MSSAPNIDQAWLDRVRLASVRFGGASGGLVSPEGLILTNEHVVAGCVENLVDPQQHMPRPASLRRAAPRSAPAPAWPPRS